jgi:hypothetical protein
MAHTTCVRPDHAHGMGATICFYLMHTKIPIIAFQLDALVWLFWPDAFFRFEAGVWDKYVSSTWFYVCLNIHVIIYMYAHIHMCIHSVSDDDPCQTSSFIHRWFGRSWWWSLGVFSPTVGHLQCCVLLWTDNRRCHSSWVADRNLPWGCLYGTSVTPKMHYLVHLPKQILMWVFTSTYMDILYMYTMCMH